MRHAKLSRPAEKHIEAEARQGVDSYQGQDESLIAIEEERASE
jgi:hypothetical protein